MRYNSSSNSSYKAVTEDSEFSLDSENSSSDSLIHLPLHHLQVSELLLRSDLEMVEGGVHVQTSYSLMQSKLSESWDVGFTFDWRE
jgi:hypothetical protein